MMGEMGRDIKLSPAAERIIPFDIECKNHQNFNRNSAIEQSLKNTKPNRISLVVFRRNRSKTYSIIERQCFLDYISKNNIIFDFNSIVIEKQNFDTWKEIQKIEKLNKQTIIVFKYNDKIYFIVEINALFNLIFDK